ncbi:MAG TPA: transglycosylase SLT domain-containing protein [Hyphomicrobiales bacterium]|nr:transglycosylase SLT domain-containing protein [Hyphomicrobiales bacterium]
MRPIRFLLIPLVLLLGACASTPSNTANVCSMFEERSSWFKAARKAQDRWDIPVPVSMAFIERESGFRARAKPPRTRILWIIPGPRPSNAFGYAQALDSTWSDYKDASGNWFARRSNFADAVDFVAWYNHMSVRQNGIPPSDAYSLYLAYHEGNGGYRRGTYAGKEWLLSAARNVQSNASRYETQLQTCESRLGRSWLRRLLF